jgi:transcriptional regulator with XRE-family HTH domain
VASAIPGYRRRLSGGAPSGTGYLIASRAEFDLARAVIQARAKAGLTQAQLARRMWSAQAARAVVRDVTSTTQSVIARLESGRARPSTKTLERLATATGTRLRITFEV